MLLYEHSKQYVRRRTVEVSYREYLESRKSAVLGRNQGSASTW